MILRLILLLLWCTDIANGNQAIVKLDRDIPMLRVKFNTTASLTCCYKVDGHAVEPTWVITVRTPNVTDNCRVTNTVHIDKKRVTQERANSSKDGLPCHMLKVREVGMNDTGLYRCLLNHTSLYSILYTHGTFLQVHKPMPKFLDISESAKNRIILTEAILLLLCVLVPGVPLLLKKKRLNKLDKKKNKAEEENLYEGLNLEDFNSTYYQIQRSQVRSPYQDVDNMGAEDVQLEKP